MELFDTHCHIHFPDYALDAEATIIAAKDVHVTRALCVGCTLADSKLAVALAARHKSIWATVGIHPHEAKEYIGDPAALQQFRELASHKKVVAIGETGFDFYYNHSPKDVQEQLFRFQIDVALESGLPLVFHVRNAFDYFWKIVDEYKGLRGVVHSFSATSKELEAALSRGFYIGLNGIMTFTKDEKQLAAAKEVPLDRLLLETDAPFLTPAPFRGTICEPKHVRTTAEFLSALRGESLNTLAVATSTNAQELFGV